MNKNLIIIKIALLLQVLSLQAQDFQVYYNLVNLNMKKHNYDSALFYFNKAIGLKPDSLVLYIERGRIYQFLGKLEHAFSEYTRVIEADSMCGRAYGSRGDVYLKTKQYSKAVSDYKKSIELAPDDYYTYYSYINLGLWILEENGNNDTALYYVNKAIDLTKKFKYSKSIYSYNYYTRGKIFFREKEYQQAINDFTSSIDSGSKLPDCFLMRANAYKKLGIKDKTAQDIKKYKELKAEKEKKIDW
jgi:tetratricopeptide (TPR) repeat protein